MQSIKEIQAQVQGPSPLLYTLYDSENYRKHRSTLRTVDSTFNTTSTHHLKHLSHAKPAMLLEERASEIERDNRNLFSKIERIVNRNGPFKMVPSQTNPSKQVKAFHPPGEQSSISTFTARPTFSLKKQLKQQRQQQQDQIQKEN
jgi:hypothetical protein